MHASMGRARHLVRFLALSLLMGVAGSALAGCGASPGGRPPVDSPIYGFQKPDAEDFEEDTDDDEDADSASDDADDASAED